MKIAPLYLAAAASLASQASAQLTDFASDHAPASGAARDLIDEEPTAAEARKLQASESMPTDAFINKHSPGHNGAYSKSGAYGKSGKKSKSYGMEDGMWGKSGKAQTCSIESLDMTKFRLVFDRYASGIHTPIPTPSPTEAETPSPTEAETPSPTEARPPTQPPTRPPTQPPTTSIPTSRPTTRPTRPPRTPRPTRDPTPSPTPRPTTPEPTLPPVFFGGGYVGCEVAGLKFQRPEMHEYQEGEVEGTRRARKLHGTGTGYGSPDYYPVGVMEAHYCSAMNYGTVRMIAVQTSPVVDGVIMIRIVPDQVNTGRFEAGRHNLEESEAKAYDFVLEGGYNCYTGELTIGYTDHTPEQHRYNAPDRKLVEYGPIGPGNIGNAYTAYNIMWSPFVGMSEEGCVCGEIGECRSLGELETVPGQRLLGHVAEHNGDLAGNVASKDDVLPGKACDILKEYVADLYQAEDFPQVGTVPRVGQNLPKEEIYTLELDGETLIDLIGKDASKQLVSSFYETMKSEVPITKINLQVGKNGDMAQSISHHKDDETTLLVFLDENSDSFKGGNLDYLTEDGHVAFEVKKGRGVAHGPNTIHGVKQWVGDRYVLSLGSSGMDSDCMLRSVME